MVSHDDKPPCENVIPIGVKHSDLVLADVLITDLGNHDIPDYQDTINYTIALASDASKRQFVSEVRMSFDKLIADVISNL